MDTKKHLCSTDAALLVLRLALGAIFILHGYGKVFGHMPSMEMFSGMVSKIGFPMPGFFAWVAALTEFAGGIAILLGICTRVAGPFIAFEMFVTTVFVKKFLFPAADEDLALFAIAIAITLMGPGCYSLAKALKWKMLDASVEETPVAA